MADLDVRIERLPGMWVAPALVSGESPKVEAWRRLREWATANPVKPESNRKRAIQRGGAEKTARSCTKENQNGSGRRKRRFRL
jgi:hypothetical protein